MAFTIKILPTSLTLFSFVYSLQFQLINWNLCKWFIDPPNPQVSPSYPPMARLFKIIIPFQRLQVLATIFHFPISYHFVLFSMPSMFPFQSLWTFYFSFYLECSSDRCLAVFCHSDISSLLSSENPCVRIKETQSSALSHLALVIRVFSMWSHHSTFSLILEYKVLNSENAICQFYDFMLISFPSRTEPCKYR